MCKRPVIISDIKSVKLSDTRHLYEIICCIFDEMQHIKNGNTALKKCNTAGQKGQHDGAKGQHGGTLC